MEVATAAPSQSRLFEFHFGTLQGLTLTGDLSAAAGSAVLATTVTLLARRLGRLPMPAAIGAGLAGAALHWLSDTAHQLGHARAASGAGYPMTGINYQNVIARSVYPPDEPALPAEIHVRRALGGPPVNLAVGLLTALPAYLLRGRGALGFLTAFACLENLLIFGLGAFVPLGFTDGSSLLRWGTRGRGDAETRGHGDGHADFAVEEGHGPAEGLTSR